MIKAIIFDCFGVIANDVWLAFLQTLPADADLEEAAALNRAYDAGIISSSEFEAGMIDAVGKLPLLLENAKPGEMVKNTELLDLIRTLKPDYKMGILSNIYSDWMRTTFLTADEQALFDDMVFSYEVGMLKPDPEMFALACSRLGVEPETAIMVDDREHNVLAAQKAGMQGILFQTVATFKEDLDVLLNSNK
jgi:FMN phosphatase YigB (HAD superfamily)